MTNTTVSIIGCGWLGLPLAGHLLSWQYRVYGSTTSKEKLSTLRKWGIRPFLFDLDKPEKWDEKLFNSAVIIINIPPSKSKNFIENLDKALKHCKGKKVLFISSTSVYGPAALPVTESAETLSPLESKLVKAELLLRKHVPDATILRPAGLIGPNRPPGRFLAGKTDVSGAGIPVNFVALEDLVTICAEIIGQERWGYTFNVANPQHPAKEEYYTFAAQQMKLTPPVFDQKKELEGYKYIDGSAVVNLLKIVYQDISWSNYIKSLH